MSGRALNVCVVAQAWQRYGRDAQPGELLGGVHRVLLAAGQGPTSGERTWPGKSAEKPHQPVLSAATPLCQVPAIRIQTVTT